MPATWVARPAKRALRFSIASRDTSESDFEGGGRMVLKQMVASVTVGLVLAVAPAALADTTIISSTGQSDTQAANSTQSATNGEGGNGPLTPSGDVFTYPGSGFVAGDSAPATVQLQGNVVLNGEAIGGGAADTTLIAPSATNCVCQSSTQGVNSDQEVGGTQFGLNVIVSGETIAGDIGDLVLVGGANQTNQQGTNSLQSGTDTQNLINVTTSAIILGA
jgi:hypothetical protein